VLGALAVTERGGLRYWYLALDCRRLRGGLLRALKRLACCISYPLCDAGVLLRFSALLAFS